jgi:hypothetical protein
MPSFMLSSGLAAALVALALLAAPNTTSASAAPEPVSGSAPPEHLYRCLGCSSSAVPMGPDVRYLRVWKGTGDISDPSNYAIAAKIIAGASFFTPPTDNCKDSHECEATCHVMYTAWVKVEVYDLLVDVSDLELEIVDADGDPFVGQEGGMSMGDIEDINETGGDYAKYLFVDAECGRSDSVHFSYALDWSTIAWPYPLPPDYVPPHYFEEALGGAPAGSGPGDPVVGDRGSCLQLSISCERCIKLDI